jgi:hypothetical protein
MRTASNLSVLHLSAIVKGNVGEVKERVCDLLQTHPEELHVGVRQ